MEPGAVHYAEVWEGVLDVDDAFGADDGHAFVDIERSLFRHAPHGLQRRGGAALEAEHGLSDVGMLEPPHVAYRVEDLKPHIEAEGVEVLIPPFTVGDFLEVVFVRKHGMVFEYMRYLKDGWFDK